MINTKKFEKEFPEENIAEFMIGAVPPHIKYIDDEKIVVHDYHGIYVYSLKTRQCMFFLDLLSRGYDEVQGDNPVEVKFSKDGKKCYISKQKMPNDGYEFDLNDYLLKEYHKEVETEYELMTSDYIDSTYPQVDKGGIYKGRHYYLGFVELPTEATVYEDLNLIIESHKGETEIYDIF